MVATTLKQREIAIIGYNTDDPGGTPSDTISFVILAPIGSGTQIFFTDRAWNGTTFAAAGGGDGTFTYMAVSDLPAGTIVTITQAQLNGAGINLSDAGETIYVYQGTDANTPVTFLYAADIADNNTTFNGSLVNTGLSVANGTATAIAGDNGTFGDRGHNIQTGDLLNSISSSVNWTSNDDSPQNPITGNLLSAPDQYVFTVIAGDAGLLRMSRDGANVATQALHHFQTNPSPATQFNHPNDIVFDTVHGLFFIADSDTGNRRVLQGNIADLFNPGVLPVLTVLYTDQTPGTGNGQINGLAIDIDHATGQGALYFVNQDDLLRVVYDHDGTSPTNQTPVNLASVPAGQFANELTLDIATGRAWIVSTASATEPITVPAGTPGAIFDPDSGTWYIVATNITNNEIYQVSNLARSDTNNSGNTVVALDLNGATAGTDLVDEQGLLSSVDVDPITGHVYFVTIQINNGINGALGGIYRYNLGTGVVELLYSEGNATDYGFKYIDVDPETGRYYVTNISFESPGDINGTANNTSSVMFHATSVGAPTVFHANAGNINSGVPWGLIVDNAPTLTGTNLNPGQTETAGNPSPNPTAVTPANAFTAMDIDTDLQVDQLGGALVRVSAGFQTGGGHQDVLTIGGLTSGTFSAGAAGAAQDITFSYNSATGVMTLTGASTFAGYQAALAAVQFQANGDNPTNYGANGTRTISYSVSDGLMYSDEVHATVTVTGINDAPVNANAGADSGAEDATFNIAGLSVSDVDADPSAAGGQQLTVTLTVTRGTLTLNTGVAGGIVSGDIIGGAQGTATITIQASAAEINATFANATGVQYTGGTNVNGTVTLSVVTNDGGFNGTDPLLTGTGTTEQDSDNYTITVTAVNDAPTVGDGTEDAAAILEDVPLTNLNAPTVATLFGVQFSDAADDQTAFPGGSSPNTFAGIAVITNASSGATGQWQYWTGAAWVNIGSPGAGSATFVRGDALLRFEPALNYNGNAPALVAHLVDNSAGSPTVNGASINLLVTPPGGTSPYSNGTVTLSQAITPVNDPPTQTNLNGDAATWTEGGAAVLLDVGSNATIADIDSMNFDTGTLTVTISVGAVPAEEGLFIETAGGITSNPITASSGTVSFMGTEFATYLGGGFAGGNITFTFDAEATPAAVQALIRAMSYNNNGGGNPTEGTRLVSWTLVDGDGNANGGSGTLLIGTSINVTGVNSPPEGADNTLALNEDATRILTQGNFGFSDPTEGDGFAGVVITTLPTNGTLLLNGTPITVAGTFVTVTQINSDQLVFQPDADEHGTPYGSFTFQVRDDGGIANGGQDTDQSADTLTFNVNPVNDAPVNSVPGGTQALNEDASVTLSTGTGNAISVADIDATTLTVTLSVAHGTLTLTSTAGLTFAPGGGDGTADATMTFSGTAAAINAALGAGLTYNPTGDYNGPDAISIVTADNGQTGTGPTGTDSDSVAITVNSVNDTPSGADKTVTVNEDDTYTFTIADFGFSDPADGNAFASVFVNGVPAQGALRLNGIQVVSGQTISTADIGNSLLTFTPNPDEFGTNYGEFSFQVQDDGGGSTFFDPTSNKITIDVTPDNLPPAVDLDGATGGDNYATAYIEDAPGVAIGSGVTVTDPDSGLGDMIESATITLTDRVAGDALTLTGVLPPGIISVTTPTAGAITIEITGTGTGAQYQALIESIQYSTTSQDPTVGGTDLARTITVTANDGTIDSAVATTTVTITASDDAPVAQPDAFTITEAGSIVGGNVFASNGSGPDSDPDGPPLAVSAVGGGTVGVQFMLLSGALLRVNANGTFDYNPNGAFDATPTLGSGASNTPDGDTFSYTLAGGGTAMVSVTITGLDTDDTLLGTAGLDALSGGAGNDTYYVENSGDQVLEFNGGGNDRIVTSASYTLGGNSFVETLEAIAGVSALSLTGNYLPNTLIGNAGANTLHGAGGVDVLIGLGGNDIYYTDVAATQVFEASGGGNDQLYTSVSYVLGTGEVELLSTNSHGATTAINLTGNGYSQTLVGNNGANQLHGGGGIDTLIGYGGNDIYYTDVAATKAFEAIGGGNDQLYTSVSYTLASGSEIELLSTNSHVATAAINLTGNGFNNTVFGNAGANVLDGKGGADTLIGLGGADTFAFTSALGGGNIDVIGDFSTADDTIALDDAIFTALGLGALSANAFVTGSAALDADDRIIYNISNGGLYYDADGSGAGAAVQFATLSGVPFTSSDFIVI